MEREAASAEVCLVDVWGRQGQLGPSVATPCRPSAESVDHPFGCCSTPVSCRARVRTSGLRVLV